MGNNKIHTKAKVLTSYLFIIVVAGIAITYFYNTINRVTKNNIPFNNHKKIYYITQTLSNLYENEVSERIDNEMNLNIHHKHKLKNVELYLDSLKSLSSDSNQITQINSIIKLLEQKKRMQKH